MINLALMAPLWSPKGSPGVSEWWGSDSQTLAYDVEAGSFPAIPSPWYVYRRLVTRTPTSAGDVQTSVVDTDTTPPSVTWIPGGASPAATLVLDNASLGRWIFDVTNVTGSGGFLQVPGSGTQILSLASAENTNTFTQEGDWAQSGFR